MLAACVEGRRSPVSGRQLNADPLDGVKMAEEITRRPGSDLDREFLYALLRRSLGPHIEATYGRWDEAWQREYFLKTTDPSKHEILESNGEAIGCLLVEERPQSLQLHRILLLPEHQNRGIGARVMQQLMARASSQGKAFRLQVFRVNPAVHFYERLGFKRIGETETHFLMEHAV